MVRGTGFLLCHSAGAVNKTLLDLLVCPLSKRPLRHCKDTQSLISDAIGVSFPTLDGIPCLVPKDGKLIEDSAVSDADNSSNSFGNSHE